MTSLLLILSSRGSYLEVEDKLEESNCSGSLYADFFLILLKKLSLFSTTSLCSFLEACMLRTDRSDAEKDLALLQSVHLNLEGSSTFFSSPL